MHTDTAGDPITGIKWTRRTTEKIATELRAVGIDVCPNTVAKLLKGLEYRLRVNHKKLCGGSRATRAERDAQFAYIATQREAFARAGLPIVSIDSKKRELVGNFKNNGATWNLQPTLVNDHDFRSDAKGIALPYGIYDLAANHGHLFVGTSHDTPAFAVDNLSKWWLYHGRHRLPQNQPSASPSRRRRQQRSAQAGLETLSPRTPRRPPRPYHHRMPLPHWRLQVQPHRAPNVQ
jgi:hypothetical protein